MPHPFARTLVFAVPLTLMACGGATTQLPAEDGTSGSDAGEDAGSSTSGATTGSTANTDAADAESGSTTGADPDPRPIATALPIEVLGLPESEAVEVAVVLELDAAALRDPSPRLRLTVHNVVAAGAFFVDVGDASFDLGDSGGPFVRPQGGASSGELLIDPAVLREGANEVVFRYAAQVPDVSGFRVVAVAVEAGGERYAPTLPIDDPGQWQPPSSDADAIERGRMFFAEISRDGGPVCAACHADSGADLQYFAFSNPSIVARAMFHEFSREESEDIASYIRSLDVPAVGRIAGPVFQPGAAATGAAGAGLEAIVADDEAFAEAAFGAAGLPDEVPWDWASTVDTFTMPTPVQLPSWFRWMPRQIDDTWFERNDGALAVALDALRADPSDANAAALQFAAVEIGLQLLFEDDSEGRVDLLRFVAVKLWDWSRERGFDDESHGVPDWGTPYAYEVGFAFFEAAAGEALPQAWAQTYEWWWAQLAVNPGRGLADGDRPINYEDLLLAADASGAGPAALTFLHLVGTWEESQAGLAGQFGTESGPVRLLGLPMLRLSDAALRAKLLRRFVARTSQHVDTGGALTSGFETALANAWAAGCPGLSPPDVDAIQAAAPPSLQSTLQECPR